MSNGADSDAVFRAKLGGRLVMGASLGVILLGIIVIGAAAWGNKDSPVKDAAQLIFTAILPLLGTWVGTVLAFYYTKENFEAASRSTLEAVRSGSQRLASTRATDAMMPVAKVVKATIPSGKAIEDLSLKDVGDLFNTTVSGGQKISRLLIVDDKVACVGILHRSIWMEMLNLGATLTPPVNPASDNLAKLLPEKSSSGTTFKEVITGTLAYIAADRTLADAKAAMEAKPLCQDVIVTSTGKSDEPMLGWISNVDIARFSQA
jgi:hypothetical protein